MLKKQAEIDFIGAEALPAGLAEIHRVLRPELSISPSERTGSKLRSLKEFFAQRTRRQTAI